MNCIIISLGSTMGVMNIYLDIDGVLVGRGRVPALHLKDFLTSCVDNHAVYWLTTHCKGDAGTAVTYLEQIFDKETLEMTKKIKPTTWSYSKTEGIDFSKSFLWFDDYIFEYEKKQLRKNDCFGSWIHVDLVNNPNHLKDLLTILPR